MLGKTTLRIHLLQYILLGFTFDVEAKIVEVDFHPVNSIEKQLYQVYIPIDGKLYRIHMQKAANGSFKIALPDQVPGAIKELVSSFEQAIIES